MANTRPKTPGNLLRVGSNAPGGLLGGDDEVYIDRVTGRHWEHVGGSWGLVIQPSLPTTKLTGQIDLASQVSGSLPYGSISGSPLIVAGAVASNTTIISGTGFTVTSGGTGIYNIAFGTSFGTAPIVVATISDAGSNGLVDVDAVTATSAQILTYSAVNVFTNIGFSFIAVRL